MPIGLATTVHDPGGHLLPGIRRAGAALALRLDTEQPGVNAVIEELRQKGVKIVSDIGETPVCYEALIQDPDGNLLLIHQRKDGTAG